jgi:hypothetical protein
VQSQLEAAHTERARLQELVEATTEQGTSEVQARLEATLLQLSQLQVCACLVHDDDDADEDACAVCCSRLQMRTRSVWWRGSTASVSVQMESSN